MSTTRIGRVVIVNFTSQIIEMWIGIRSFVKNRQTAEQRIGSGEMQGYLAYLDDRVVGWCNAAPRQKYPALVYDTDLAPLEDTAAGSIVCFIVAPPFRNQGVATALLETACEGFAMGAGLRWAEGYPRVSPASPASNYHGPLQMYQQAGFEMHRQFPTFYVVRKAL